LRASKIMADRVQSLPNVSFRWSTAVSDVLGEDRVTGVMMQDVGTGTTESFPCDGLFIAIGYTPNTGFLAGKMALNGNGYIAVRDHTRSSVEGIFVAGDVEDFRYRQAVTAAAGGCMAAMDAEKWLETQH
ncbi:MAG: FAD-dependent oxidoreductase, partial [bacterium]|nr:FAD-dependent oxidoreductase [bacterium]